MHVCTTTGERVSLRMDIATEMLRWQNREIDNYECIAFLNTAADRSVNDITQYPGIDTRTYIVHTYSAYIYTLLNIMTMPMLLCASCNNAAVSVVLASLT
jgi:Beige/BEACH domain